jgi:ABC-type nitrate/sulfonate/bicarbonate transport system substrate-binding protein
MRTIRIAITDLVSNSYFPALAAEELGFYRDEGVDGRVELVMPLSDAYERLTDGSITFVADGIHDSFVVWPRWNGLRALMTLQQGTPWLLVVRSDLDVPRGDLESLKGMRIAAALGPDAAFRRLLQEVGLDEGRDGIEICRLPGAEVAGMSYGVTAARALESHKVDGFWANAMGAALAVHRGAGRIHMDVRRGDGPDSARSARGGAPNSARCVNVRVADDRSHRV